MLVQYLCCRTALLDVLCFLQYLVMKAGILRPEKRKMTILNDVTSVVQPGRMTLLLGPPAAGKSTLLKALAGRLAHEGGLKVNRAPGEHNVCRVHAFYLLQALPFVHLSDVVTCVPA